MVGTPEAALGTKLVYDPAHNHTRALIVASGAGSSIRSTERANVLNLSVLPHKRSHLRGGWEKSVRIGDIVVPEAYHLAGVIHRNSDAGVASQKGSNVHHLRAFP